MSSNPFEELFGSELQHGKETVPIKDVQGKFLAIYFSAHWCGPCRAFTPQLIKFYDTLRKTRSDFEFIFVSSDRDQAAFDEYYGSMPWLALPFSQREKKAELSSKYGVQGIPTLVFVDKDGNTLTTQGRSKVMTDPNGENFPYAPKPLTETLGNTFVNGKGEKVTLDLNNKIFGLYFSAHWCPPCRSFTPVFSEAYQKLKAEGVEFEVIFVSSDRDENSFKEYMAEMPWHAIPFDERNKAAELGELFEVEGIPTLVIIDKDLSVITDGGVQSIRGGEAFPYRPQVLSQLTEANISNVNKNPCLFVYEEESKLASIGESLKPLAKEIEDGKKSLKLMYSSKSEIGGTVLEFASIGEFPSMFILDVPGQKKYVYSGEINQASITSFAQDFMSKKLTPVPIR